MIFFFFFLLSKTICYISPLKTGEKNPKVMRFSSFIVEMFQTSKWKTAWWTLKTLGGIWKETLVTWTVSLLCASKHHSIEMTSNTASPQQLGNI